MPEETEATMVIGKLLGRCNVLHLRIPDLEIRGMGRSKKILSRPLGPQFGPKVRGRAPRAPPLDLPLTCKDIWMQAS